MGLFSIHHRRLSRRHSRRGNSLTEFALVAIFLVPLFLGTVNVGLNLSRSVQVAQLTRDAGHMFARQVDFSLNANKDLIIRLASGLDLTLNGGEGVVILTKVMYISDQECTLGGFSVGACANRNNPVITQRIVIGNVSKRSSDFGTPADNLLAGDGTLDPVQFTNNGTLIATGLNTVLPGMIGGDVAYIVEAYFSGASWYMAQNYTSDGAYARAIY